MMMMMGVTEEAKPQEKPETSYDLSDLGDSGLGRRVFIGGLFGLFAAVWAAFIAGPVLSFLWPKAEKIVKLDRLVLGKVSEFPPGSAKNFKFGAIPALFVHGQDGKLFAYNATCSHLGCTVQYQKDKNNIFCACHGGTYDVTSGKVIAGPPPEGLKTLVAVIEKDDIVIKPA
jgi:cytochrome b6-f complex iron-sulfur subunit